MVSGFYWHQLLMEMEVSLHFLYLFEVALSPVMIVAGCTLFQKKGHYYLCDNFSQNGPVFVSNSIVQKNDGKSCH